MKSLTPLLLIAFSVFMLACQSTDDPAQGGDETAFVELAEEKMFDLEASTMSESAVFSYTVHYDGNEFAYTDGRLNGASEYGLNLVAKTGAELVTATLPLGEAFPAQEEDLVESRVCKMEYASIDHEQETLHFRLKVCEGQEADWLLPAFYDLVEATTLQPL